MREEITVVLTTNNPQYVSDEVMYSFSQGEFVPKPPEGTGRSYVVFFLQGTAIRKDGEEAKAQVAAGYGIININILIRILSKYIFS